MPDSIIPCICEDCETKWKEHFITPMLVAVFCAKLKAIRCPHCGSTKVGIYEPKKSSV
jgi:hypothetical protein